MPESYWEIKDKHNSMIGTFCYMSIAYPNLNALIMNMNDTNNYYLINHLLVICNYNIVYKAELK